MGQYLKVNKTNPHVVHMFRPGQEPKSFTGCHEQTTNSQVEILDLPTMNFENGKKTTTNTDKNGVELLGLPTLDCGNVQ